MKNMQKKKWMSKYYSMIQKEISVPSVAQELLLLFRYSYAVRQQK